MAMADASKGNEPLAPRNLQERIAGSIRNKLPPIAHKAIAEACGLYFIVLMGCGAGHVGVFVTSISLWEACMIWAFAIAVATYATDSVSGAHLNPAVTLAFATFRANKFPLHQVPWYVLAQLVGAMLAGYTNYFLYSPTIERFEARHNITRGSPESINSAFMYGEYFPNPGAWHYPGTSKTEDDGWVVGKGRALCTEIWAAAILMFIVLAIGDKRNKALKNKDLAPFFVGFAVALIVCSYAPITQSCLNPARDLGPRLAALTLGWGSVALPGPRHGYWIYLVGPTFGAQVGAFLYSVLIDPGLPPEQLEDEEAAEKPAAAEESPFSWRSPV